MSWLDTRTQTGLGLKMDEDQQAGILFFSPADLYRTNRSNKLLLPFLQPRQSIWLQQKLERKPCGLVNFSYSRIQTARSIIGVVRVEFFEPVFPFSRKPVGKRENGQKSRA